MSDIKCVVCGEEWEAYGIDHGDLLPWEAKLFKQGAGCPECEGEPNGWKPESISDVENGDEDPMLRILAREAFEDGTAPKWERPSDPIHWTCNGCGVEIITNLDDDELDYHVRYQSKAHGWYHSHPFRNGCPEKEPAHRFEIAKDTYLNVCEFCLTHCTECDAPLSEHLELDIYAEGYAMPSPADPHHEHVCSDCHSAVETKEADRVWAGCYSDAERIEYIRDHREQFEFQTFAEMISCVRGHYFCGYASEIL